MGGRGWQFPQGGVNRGERVEDALFRELEEEIGLERQDVEVLGSTQGWLRYRLPRQYVRDRCIGQKQRWFLLKLVADESKLRFDSTDTPEFDRWRWSDYWTPVREVVYFKRRVLRPGASRPGQGDVPRGSSPLSGMGGPRSKPRPPPAKPRDAEPKSPEIRPPRNQGSVNSRPRASLFPMPAQRAPPRTGSPRPR